MKLLVIWNRPMPKFWSRDDYFKIIWKGIYEKHECPLCDFDWNKGHTIWEWNHLHIIHNIFPYSWDDKHLMVVPYTHKDFSHELTVEELSEMKEVYNFMKEFYWEEHYFSCTRESYWNRSIKHYHMHFLPWRLEWKFLRKMLKGQGFPIDDEL